MFSDLSSNIENTKLEGGHGKLRNKCAKSVGTLIIMAISSANKLLLIDKGVLNHRTVGRLRTVLWLNVFQ